MASTVYRVFAPGARVAAAPPARARGDHVVAGGSAGDEGARIGNVHANVVAPVDVTGEVRVPAAHQANDLRIDLDGIDPPRPVIERAQHAGPAAGVEHQHRRPIGQVVG